MKSSEWLFESEQDLKNYLDNNGKFTQVEKNYYLFVWTPETLADLLKHGANPSIVKDAKIPNHGIGVVNVVTKDVALFALDSDYKPGGISSMGTFSDIVQSRFFKYDPDLYDDILGFLGRLGIRYKNYYNGEVAGEKKKDPLAELKEKMGEYGRGEELLDTSDLLMADNLPDAKKELEIIALDAQNTIGKKRMEFKKARKYCDELPDNTPYEEYSAACDKAVDLEFEVQELEWRIEYIPKFIDKNEKLFKKKPEPEKSDKQKKRELLLAIEDTLGDFTDSFPGFPVPGTFDFDPKK